MLWIAPSGKDAATDTLEKRLWDSFSASDLASIGKRRPRSGQRFLLGKLPPPQAIFAYARRGNVHRSSDAAQVGADAPYPGYKTIAMRMGVSDKTARRLGKSLEDKRYLVREIRQANTNRFHLAKLMSALVALKRTTKPKEQK